MVGMMDFFQACSAGDSITALSAGRLSPVFLQPTARKGSVSVPVCRGTGGLPPDPTQEAENKRKGDMFMGNIVDFYG